MKAKAVILSVTFVFTLIFAGAAVVSRVSADDGKEIACFGQGIDNSYVLREFEGYVAVFVENNPDCPMTVTDIQVATLRELDKKLLQTGMKVRSHERLVMTLEDLGS